MPRQFGRLRAFFYIPSADFRDIISSSVPEPPCALDELNEPGPEGERKRTEGRPVIGKLSAVRAGRSAENREIDCPRIDAL